MPKARRRSPSSAPTSPAPEARIGRGAGAERIRRGNHRGHRSIQVPALSESRPPGQQIPAALHCLEASPVRPRHSRPIRSPRAGRSRGRCCAGIPGSAVRPDRSSGHLDRRSDRPASTGNFTRTDRSFAPGRAAPPPPARSRARRGGGLLDREGVCSAPGSGFDRPSRRPCEQPDRATSLVQYVRKPRIVSRSASPRGGSAVARIVGRIRRASTRRRGPRRDQSLAENFSHCVVGFLSTSRLGLPGGALTRP